MRIFYVEEDWDKDELLKKFTKDNTIEHMNCRNIKDALAQANSSANDKISLIILDNNFKSSNEEKANRLKVQTFGNFEVFYQDKPVSFIRAKSKELLAYLIDRRGATVTTPEACGILWEGKEYNFSLQRQFQTVVSDLMKSLKKHNLESLIHRRRNCLSVEVSKLECDLYRLLEGDEEAKQAYNGEYMSNYSWAEMTAGFLSQKYNI